MVKKSKGARAAPENVEILAGRVYCLTQRSQYYGVNAYEAHLNMLGAATVEKLDGSVTHLMTVDGTLGKTVQKKVDSLVKKGAVIDVIDHDEMRDHIAIPSDLAARLLEGTDADREWLKKYFDTYEVSFLPIVITGTNLQGLHWEPSMMSGLKLVDVNLSEAVLPRARVSDVEGSTFDGATLHGAYVDDAVDSSFKGADLTEGHVGGTCAGSTFEGANFRSGTIRIEVDKKRRSDAPVFRSAHFEEARVRYLEWDGLDFTGSSGAKSQWERVTAPGILLTGSDLSSCSMEEVDLQGADLTDVNFQNAHFSSVNFKGATLQGADFTGATMVNCTWDKSVDPSALAGLAGAMEAAPKAGKHLKALDAAFKRAKKVKIDFLFETPAGAPAPVDPDAPEGTLEIEGGNDTYGFDVTVHYKSPDGGSEFARPDTLTEAFLRGVSNAAGAPVRFGSVRVRLSKSPVPGPKIRELTIAALAETLNQPLPDEAELKALTKVYRAELKARAAAVKAAQPTQKAVAAARAQPTSKVKDFDSFVAALDVRVDHSRLAKAKKMLKGEGFQLFHSVSKGTSGPCRVRGIIKSQTDADLLYACTLDDKGEFSCCTQNLRACGGLRGALCKHQLVLLMGLVQAGVLDPKMTDDWVHASLDNRPELDQDEMSELLLKYKGAQAGEIDWRPTETVPEDFYTF